MGTKELIARQYNYGCWARDKLLREARKLNEHEYHAKPDYGGLRSVHELLLHTLSTEWLWRNLAIDGALAAPPPDGEKYTTLEDLEDAWHEEEMAYRDFLQTLGDEDLQAEINTVSPAGQPFTFSRWDMMQHALLHGVQHRAETAAVLSSHGRSPGDLDFIFYVIGRD